VLLAPNEIVISSDSPGVEPSARVEIVATDFYPSVLDNLAFNIEANVPASHQSTGAQVQIKSLFLDWASYSTGNSSMGADDNIQSLAQPFDLILGADIVYEKDHAVWIKEVLRATLLRPTPVCPHSEHPTSLPAVPPPTFHLVIPLRETFKNESSTIEEVFSFAAQSADLKGIPPDSDAVAPELVIYSKEVITCDAASGKEGEVVIYAYYCIGWA
jgi:hypothetical protein